MRVFCSKTSPSKQSHGSPSFRHVCDLHLNRSSKSTPTGCPSHPTAPGSGPPIAHRVPPSIPRVLLLSFPIQSYHHLRSQMPPKSKRAAGKAKSGLSSENTTDPKRRSASTAGRAFAEIKTYQSTQSMCVNEEELELLEPGVWLNSHIINYAIWTIANTYIETRLGEPVEITFLPTLTWADYCSGGVYNSRTPSHPFLSPFVVLPLNLDDHHWIVVIVSYCNTNLLINGKDEDPTRPASIFVLDPMRESPRDEELEQRILGFLGVMGSAQAGFLPEELNRAAIFWPDAVSLLYCLGGGSSPLTLAADPQARQRL